MPADNPSPTAPPRRPGQLASDLSRWVQLVFLVALFVLWQVEHWSFARSVELCVVGGILFYSALNLFAALQAAWSGPAMAARLARVAAVVLYVIMRYVLHRGFLHAVLIWGVLWIVASYLVGHTRRRAATGAPVRISPVKE